MLVAMIIVYVIPFVLVAASLLVRPRDRRRNILYLSTVLAASIIILVVVAQLDRELWGFWTFFVLPTALVTGIRLLIAVTLNESRDAEALQ